MTQTNLLRRARGHDIEARNQLVEKWMPLIAKVVSRMRTPPGAFEDLVQEAALGVLKKLHRYDEARGPFLSWLIFTVRHVILDHLRLHGGGVVRVNRRQYRELQRQGTERGAHCLSLDDERHALRDRLPSRVVPHTEQVERKDLLDRAMGHITPRERRVLELLYPRDGSAPQVMRQAGRVLRISESRVAQVRHMALRKLRALAGVEGPPPPHRGAA